ncbi:hypothetical protein M569_02360 [Genlisea aurea]|uniref:Nicotiana lesion-inducing like n=1 Tax=Genlisea aurea TaxID=192259 RepID=S8CYB8_9LAMI|nr:hypothetical protein M569_02360 [Genlisea aurea]
MGFFSFLGRVFFASIFILSAWQMFNEFGDDGGPAAKEWGVKLSHAKKLIGKTNLQYDVRTLVAAIIFLKSFGGVLFVLGSSFGAYLLIYYLTLSTPLLYDFYNYQVSDSRFHALLHEFLQNVALVGALLYFLGMKSSILRRQLRKKNPKPKVA